MTTATATKPLVQRVNILDDAYPSLAVQAFDFLRACGRYTARTLMSLRTLADRNLSEWEDKVLDANHLMPSVVLPQLVMVSSPLGFDELTETKMGGVIAVGATVPGDESERGLLAVAPGLRQQGYGSLVLSELRQLARYHEFQLSMWTADSNTIAASFLARNAFIPRTISGTGLIEWTPSLSFVANVSDHQGPNRRPDVSFDASPSDSDDMPPLTMNDF